MVGGDDCALHSLSYVVSRHLRFQLYSCALERQNEFRVIITNPLKKGGRQHVQILRSRIPAKPFRLTAQFSERRGSHGSRRCRSQLIQTASSRSAGWCAPQFRHARPPLRYSRRRRDVDGPERGPRTNRGGFPQADVLVEGKKILAVGPNLGTSAALARSMRRGRIVMPGFIDTHHHQFETALRSFLADGVLINDGSGSPSGSTTYFEYILLNVRARLPAAGRLHQRAVRRT